MHSFSQDTKPILFMADPCLQAGAALRAADQGIKSFNDVWLSVCEKSANITALGCIITSYWNVPLMTESRCCFGLLTVLNLPVLALMCPRNDFVFALCLVQIYREGWYNLWRTPTVLSV